jgi:uncharacterized membrane-anchored protein YhcB (DUF1043 family)
MNMQKQFNEYQANTDKKFKKTQKQFNELWEDFNKLQNETKEITKKVKSETRHHRIWKRSITNMESLRKENQTEILG